MTEEKRHKRGDVREDGMVFWQRAGGSRGGETWLLPEKFEERAASERERVAAYYAANREEARERMAAYYAANSKAICESAAAHRAHNADEIREQRAAYRANRTAGERERLRAAARLRSRERRDSDPTYALAQRVRCLIRYALRDRGYAKESKTAEIVGCSFEDFKTHFESLFTDGMSWERFSEIHIDHIIPVSSATNEQELLALNHYTNLQPLWAKDNLQKSNKILPPKE